MSKHNEHGEGLIQVALLGRRLLRKPQSISYFVLLSI